MKPIELSIVVPAYNEEKRLPPSIVKILRYAADKKLNYELILVNNASTDNTLEVMNSFAEKNSQIKVLSTKTKGKGLAVKTGMLAAQGKYVLFTDADLSTPIEEMERFFPYLDNGYDVVYGTRSKAGAQILVAQPLYRKLLGKAMKVMVSIVIFPRPPRPTDTQCGFKMFRNEVAQELFRRQTLDGGMFDVEILFIARKHRYKLMEVPVKWANEGGSKVIWYKSMILNPARLLGIVFKDVILGYYK